MKTKTAKEVWEDGRSSDLTIKNVTEIIANLYNKDLARAWFIGLEWVEGYTYCKDFGYLEKTAAPSFLEHHLPAIWFACLFLD